jgi:pyrimidine operon attenuation protein/uracil phosphoribosyltransferase
MSEICNEFNQLFNNLERFQFPFDESKIPLNGIYILFEVGERAHGTDRIVRIGTHTGDNQLRPRLQEHFINENRIEAPFEKILAGHY